MIEAMKKDADTAMPSATTRRAIRLALRRCKGLRAGVLSGSILVAVWANISPGLEVAEPPEGFLDRRFLLLGVRRALVPGCR